MNKSKPRQSSDFAQWEAAGLLGLTGLPDPIRAADAATVLGGGDMAAGVRWLHRLRDAIAAGELPAELEPVPAKPAPPWHRDPRPLDAQLRRPAQGAPGVVIKRIRLADLRAWLLTIGAPVPEWLPGAAETVTTPAQPEPVAAEPRRTRRTALIDAMDTMRRALVRARKHEPSARETWDAFKATKDPTGAVVRVDDDVIVWRDQSGAEHSTKYKTFANSFGTLKARS